MDWNKAKMRFAQLVMGPAGCGKSTYCKIVANHGEVTKRKIHIVNLDPAAEDFQYGPVADICELISVQDAMEDSGLKFGPNGGLVFCMEYFIDNLDWLQDELGDMEDDYYLFDCPGQIELYTHMPVMKKLVESLTTWGFMVAGVFILDSQFLVDLSKFFSGTLVALSAMVNLEIPHVNILSKMDLLDKKTRRNIESFLEPGRHMIEESCGSSNDTWRERSKQLTAAIAHVLDDYSMVRFIPLNIYDEESIAGVLFTVDTCIQFGEDQEVRDNIKWNEDERDGGDDMD